MVAELEGFFCECAVWQVAVFSVVILREMPTCEAGCTAVSGRRPDLPCSQCELYLCDHTVRRVKGKRLCKLCYKYRLKQNLARWKLKQVRDPSPVRSKSSSNAPASEESEEDESED